MYSGKHVLLFDRTNTTRKTLEAVAEEFSPNYIFVLVTPNNTDITSIFHIDHYPSLILVTAQHNQLMQRYPLYGTINPITVKEHIQRHSKGQLTPAPISEPEREQDGSSAYRFTGVSIERMLQKHNIFLTTGPRNDLIDRLYLKFKDTTLIIGTYDIEKNQNELVSNNHMFQLFTTDRQTPILYIGEEDEDSITRFLNEYGFSVHSEL